MFNVRGLPPGITVKNLFAGKKTLPSVTVVSESASMSSPKAQLVQKLAEYACTVNSDVWRKIADFDWEALMPKVNSEHGNKLRDYELRLQANLYRQFSLYPQAVQEQPYLAAVTLQKAAAIEGLLPPDLQKTVLDLQQQIKAIPFEKK